MEGTEFSLFRWESAPELPSQTGQCKSASWWPLVSRCALTCEGGNSGALSHRKREDPVPSKIPLAKIPSVRRIIFVEISCEFSPVGNAQSRRKRNLTHKWAHEWPAPWAAIDFSSKRNSLKYVQSNSVPSRLLPNTCDLFAKHQSRPKIEPNFEALSWFLPKEKPQNS